MTCDEECVRSIVREELSKEATMQTDSPKKTKRKSAWNIFLADCTKKQPKGTPLGDRTKACSIEYKELKKNGSLDDFISKLQIPNNKSDNDKSDNNKGNDKSDNNKGNDKSDNNKGNYKSDNYKSDNRE
jgi:hypothetical protein